MTRQIQLSARANLDIEQVLEWTLEQFGSTQHDPCSALIRAALEEIASDLTGSRAKHRPELSSDVWVFHIGRKRHRARHFFVYRVTETSIDIARFLHDSMDLARHLPSECRDNPSDD